eukprot:ANDGO_04903.mRNA.1 hypothetical protein
MSLNQTNDENQRQAFVRALDQHNKQHRWMPFRDRDFENCAGMLLSVSVLGHNEVHFFPNQNEKRLFGSPSLMNLVVRELILFRGISKLSMTRHAPSSPDDSENTTEEDCCSEESLETATDDEVNGNRVYIGTSKNMEILLKFERWLSAILQGMCMIPLQKLERLRNHPISAQFWQTTGRLVDPAVARNVFSLQGTGPSGHLHQDYLSSMKTLKQQIYEMISPAGFRQGQFLLIDSLAKYMTGESFVVVRSAWKMRTLPQLCVSIICD